jgi:mxaJ protein
MKQFSRCALLISGLFAATMSVHANDNETVEIKPVRGQEAVRVCADGYNLPYSNKELEGFDNKIAELIGEELGLPVEYFWFPQRMGFARNTINRVNEAGDGYAFMCDIAFNIPVGSGFFATSTPYFSSIEGMVYRSDLGEINTIADLAKINEENGPLRIGIFDRAIGTKPLIDAGLRDNLVYFNIQSGDVRDNPGRVIVGETNSIQSGDLDVVFLWGPIGSYYADKSDVPVTFVPLNEITERYIFSFSAGVRRGDKRWLQVINAIFEKRKDDIEAILAEYNLPSLENVAPESESIRLLQ